MRTLFLLLVAMVGLSGAEVDLNKPVPRLRLSDGRVLQEAAFTTFRAVDIIVRHKGGVIPLRYEALPDDLRAAAEQKRPGGPKWFPGDTATDAVTVNGQVFVQTRGAGAYKFGQARVYAFEARHLQAWKEVGFDGIVRLPKALAVATTDGDGRYTLSVPKNTPFFIFCRVTRVVGMNEVERNEWRVPGESFKSLTQANLNGENDGPYSAKLEIEQTP